MASESGEKRIDSASRVIRASPRVIYQAYMDPEAPVRWLPPKGMRGRIEAFNPREGGTYRMMLTYDQPDHSAPGKTSEHSDIVRGRFLELVADARIVQLVEFESEDLRVRRCDEDDMDVDCCRRRHRSCSPLRECARRNTTGRSRGGFEVDIGESRGLHRMTGSAPSGEAIPGRQLMEANIERSAVSMGCGM